MNTTERRIITGLKYKFYLQAVHPLSSDLLLALGFEENDIRITTAAVCVYPSRVADARDTLTRMGMADKIPVASGIC
jgi:deoxyribose-phosphate aldolase